MAIHFILIIGHKESTTNYQNAVSSAGYIPVTTDTFDLLEECEEEQDSLSSCSLARMDLLILPGGGDISPDLFNENNVGSHSIDRDLDLVQFAYLQYFIARRKPVLGICKGMQLINLNFGGKILQDMERIHQNIHAYLSYRDNYHSCSYHLENIECFTRNLLSEMLDADLLPKYINSAHHQCVTELAEHLIPFCFAIDGVVEGFFHSTLPIIGIQWHPERLFMPEGSYLKLFLSRILRNI